MSLSVEQLVYTVSAGLASKMLASGNMPQAIQNSFEQAIVHPYLSNSDFAGLKMSAAYLHQVEESNGLLFGWLYCDEFAPDSGDLISHFICYYATDPLDGLKLELIFDCLEKGPVASLETAIDLEGLDPIVLPDSGDYEATRPGVEIPSKVRALNRLLLYKQKMLHCFVPLAAVQDDPESQVSSIPDLPLPDLDLRTHQRDNLDDLFLLDIAFDEDPQNETVLPVLSKRALLIGVSEHELGTQSLPGITQDLESLQQVLTHPQRGNFTDVASLLNPDSTTMAERIESFLSNCPADSLALVYFSGYGVLDRQGTLCLSTAVSRRNAQGKIIRSTFVATDFLGAVMRDSPSRQQVLILDICLSEEDPLKSTDRINDTDRKHPLDTVKQQLSGVGQTVLISSSAIHDVRAQKGSRSSIYTSYLVEGLETGIADGNGDGCITLEEWHAYAKYKIQLASPALRPALYGPLTQGQLQVASAPLNEVKLQYRRAVERFARNGQISLVNELILDDLQKSLSLTPSDAIKIKGEVLKPHKEYQSKLKKYAVNVLNQVHREFPIKVRTNSQILYLQDSLGLTDADTEPIKAEIVQKLKAMQSPETVLSPAMAEGGIRHWPTMLRSQFQAFTNQAFTNQAFTNLSPSSLSVPLAQMMAQVNRVAAVSRHRLRSQFSSNFPSRLLPNMAVDELRNSTQSPIDLSRFSVGLLAGLIGLFLISMVLVTFRQKQEQKQTLRHLGSLVQQQKYDECKTSGAALSQQTRNIASIQRLLEQCQTGLRWQNITVKSIPNSTSAIWAIAFKPNSQTLAGGGDDGKIRLWNGPKPTLTHTLEGHRNRVWSLAFSSDGQQLVSGGSDRKVKLWNLSTDKIIHVFKGHQDTVWSVALTPDGRLIASGSDDGTIKLWNAATGTLLRTLDPKAGAIRAIAFGAGGKTLISGGTDPDMTIWDIATGKVLNKLSGHNDRVIALAVSKNGETLVSSSADRSIKVWDLRKGALIRTLSEHLTTVHSLSLSADNRTLIASADGSVQVWDIQTGQLIREFSGSPSPVTTAVFGPKEQTLAIARQNKLVHLLQR